MIVRFAVGALELATLGVTGVVGLSGTCLVALGLPLGVTLDEWSMVGIGLLVAIPAGIAFLASYLFICWLRRRLACP